MKRIAVDLLASPLSAADVTRTSERFTVVTACTQFYWRGEGVLADSDAIRSVFRLAPQRLGGRRVGDPSIGAGSAEGDWTTVATILDSGLAGEDHTPTNLIAAVAR